MVKLSIMVKKVIKKSLEWKLERPWMHENRISRVFSNKKAAIHTCIVMETEYI